MSRALRKKFMSIDYGFFRAGLVDTLFRVWGLGVGFTVQGLGFRVQGLGLGPCRTLKP